MRTNTLRRVLILLCLAALPPGVLRAAPLPMPAIPPALAAPADQQVVVAVAAKGVQIYECRAVSGQPGKYEWAFKAPEADLFSMDDKVGRHYAGPTWEGNDGSKVVGKLKAKADAPDGKGIPWLLLEAAENSGAGMFGKVRSIQRVSTVGGRAPAEVADASKVGQERRVDYTANYVFYAAKP